MKVVILAGGGGTRLFPLSRQSYPKQFLKLADSDSLLGATIRRFLSVVKQEDIVLVINKDHLHLVKSFLEEENLSKINILAEPEGKNTAPAIAFAAEYLNTELKIPEEEVMLITPADHLITPIVDFQNIIIQAEEVAKSDNIILFGIKPVKPETGYGYIETSYLSENLYDVVSFKEKPDYNTARKYIDSGNFYWNSGMFAFKIKTIKQELEKYQQDIFYLMGKGTSFMKEKFSDLENISIDYAVIEKSHKVKMLALDLYWNDIGSWDAIYDVLEKDNDGNVKQGDICTFNCKNNLFFGKNRLIAGVDLENMLIVETDDVIMISPKGKSQDVKNIVAKLKEEKRKEPFINTVCYRPWGSYEVIGEGPRYKMKKIKVKPGQSLSLQMHYHRSEHWIVIAGTAEVTLGDNIQMLHENESTFIPQSVKHRLKNPGKIPLEIIEVQNGVYLEEDDIVRFEDIYGRN